MACSKCGYESPSEMPFCGQCGTPARPRCGACGHESPAGFRFCGQCGKPLAGPPSAEPPSSRRVRIEGAASGPSGPLSQRREAERRQLTVMFCDLAGSTVLSETLDPEDFREVVRAYQEACAAVVERYEGHVAQYLGDGLLVYFGYPAAHEDDARRAVKAGLEIVEAMRDLNRRLEEERGLRLAVRIGVHTGRVVVGEVGGGGRHEQLALGETPNIAARLQGLADLDAVLVSGPTHHLAGRYFDFEPLGEKHVKGITNPLVVFRALRETPRPRATSDSHPPAPVLGRDHDVALLLERWEKANQGVPQVVLLRGEAGIGKTRLALLFLERIGTGTHSLLCRCSPYHQSTPLHPVIDQLQHFFRLSERGSEDALASLREGLKAYALTDPAAVTIIASLLSVPLDGQQGALQLSPERLRQRTLEVLCELLGHIAADSPTALVIEDVHWSDPTTQELVRLIEGQRAFTPLLVLLTGRPDFEAQTELGTKVVEIHLTRLDRDQIEAIILRITGGKSLPGELTQQIVTKTDGVPLFVEELTKMILESDLVRDEGDRYELTGPLPSLAIPSTLQDSLMARLDRLAPVREVAQLAATLGREFNYRLIRAVWPHDEETLQRELGRLVEADLLFQSGAPPTAKYLFKHALIRDASYDSLLKSRRQYFHARVAQVLETQFPEIGEEQPEVLAHHLTQAGLKTQAISAWLRAAQHATRRSAYQEAIVQLRRGLEIVKSLPDSPQRAQQELSLALALGGPLLATKGYASPEVEEIYYRARGLCRSLGETPQLFAVLRGVWIFYLVRGDLDTAQEMSDEVWQLAHKTQDLAHLMEAHFTTGATAFYRGELTKAVKHLEQAAALYEPEKHHTHAQLYGQDTGVACQAFAAWAHVLLGRPDTALEVLHRLMTLSAELAHPFTEAYARHFAAIVHLHRREGRDIQRWADAEIEIAKEHAFAFWAVAGGIQRGWGLAEQGRLEEGIEEMSLGLVRWRAAGAEVAGSYQLAHLAEGYRAAGRTEEALKALAEAFEVARAHGERFYEAELYTIRGALLVGRNPTDDVAAETSFRHALEIARRQGAKLIEIRAAKHLARLLRKQGNSAEGAALLKGVYDSFTEGLGTKDLEEAKALLDQCLADSASPQLSARSKRFVA